MKIKILNSNSDSITRVETSGSIREVMINEDFLHPSNENIAIGFRGKNTSGLIEFTTKEIEDLYSKVQEKTHLIKGFKVYKE